MNRIRDDARLDDALCAPGGVVAEIINGVLYHRPTRDGFDKDHLWNRLIEALTRGCGSFMKDVAHIVCEPVLDLGVSVLQPEGAFWLAGRDVRSRTLRDRVRVYATAPDVVFELVTDETDSEVRERKLPVYLQTGVGVVWLLNLSTRTFSILIARPESWKLHALGEEAGSLQLHPFARELEMTTYWESHEEASRRRRDKVVELAARMEELARQGVGERDQVRMLLGSLDVWPDIMLWGDCVASWMLRSPSVVVRARMLMVAEVSLERALWLAREEIEAEQEVSRLTEAEAEALCLRYCEQYREHGASHPLVRALAARAHAFAREAMQELLWSRSDDGAPPDASVGALLAAYRETGREEAQVFALLNDGQGHWRPEREDWNHALRAFMESLRDSYRNRDPTLGALLQELATLAEPKPIKSYGPLPGAEPVEIYVEGQDKPMTPEEFAAWIRAGAAERGARTSNDVALRWAEHARRTIASEDADIID